MSRNHPFIVITVVIACLLLVLPLCGIASSDDTSDTPTADPGDTIATAETAELPANCEEAIEPGTDVDVYAFSIGEISEVNIDVDGVSLGNLDALLTLMDSAGETLLSADDVRGIDPYIGVLLPAGHYFVAVGSYYDNRPGAYNLKIWADPIVEGELPFTGEGTLGPGVIDTYAFQVEVTSYIVFDVDAYGIGGNLDAKLWLYDESLAEIDWNDDHNGYDPYLGKQLAPGRYYILLRQVAASEGPYTLSVGTEEGTEAAETAPILDPSEARTIVLPFSEAARIESAGDVGFFRFELLERSTVRIDVDADTLGSSLDAMLHLYDEAGTEIAVSDDVDGRDPEITRELELGVYLVRVVGYAGTSAGPYELHIAVE